MQIIELQRKSDICLQLLMLFPKKFENVNLLIDVSGSIHIPSIMESGRNISNALAAIGFSGVINILQFDTEFAHEKVDIKNEDLEHTLYSMAYHCGGGSLLIPILDFIKSRQEYNSSYKKSINIIVSDGYLADYDEVLSDDIMIQLVE